MSVTRGGPGAFANDSGLTVGVVPFPTDRSRAALLTRLDGLPVDACARGWIDNQGICIILQRKMTRGRDFRNRTDLDLTAISRRYNPVLRGWLEYYGKYQPSALGPLWRHFNKTLVSWAMRKYRPLYGHATKAGKFIERISVRQPSLFIHWQRGIAGSFA